MVPRGGGVCGKNLADSQDRGTAQVGGSPHLAQPPEAHTQANTHTHTQVPHMVPYGPPASAFGAKNCNSVYVLHMAPHPPFQILLQKKLHWCI